MTNLRDRIKKKQKELVIRSNSFIPKVVSENPFEYVRIFFQGYLRRKSDVNRVSIIDPYVLPLDMEHLTALFGGSLNISLEILSKFNSASGDDEKIERKTRINERKESLVRSGLFREIELIHSVESMHDRYYIFCSDESMIKAFYIGGSIAQRFDDYIGIMEITDSFLLNNIAIYYDRLSNKTINFMAV
ncbi:hypothetical protein P0W48_16020 [Plesiomonas shigelloides]|uniref:hypothetical protein n=1 Tax=Plesiomonas shigelloides TaxID=703 RepID=UPI003138E8E7